MIRFFAELKRRNVYRVASIYVIAAWMLTQVASIMENALSLPGWFDGFVIAALGIFFPVAIILAWAFEVTPEGIRRSGSESDPGALARPRLTDGLLLLGLIIAVGFMAKKEFFPIPSQGPSTLAEATDRAKADADVEGLAMSGDDGAQQDAQENADEKSLSIAVLPFRDLSMNGDQAYFSEGLAEEILNVLARVRDIRVASRPSSFRFRDRDDMSITEMAAALDVRYILEGSVRKAGESVRVSVRLMDGPEDRQVWSRDFDKLLTVEGIFDLQEEISVSVVESMGRPLGLERRAAESFVAAAGTRDLAAYESYLAGREIFLGRGRRMRERLGEMLGHFESATRRDPQFAKAWESLAVAYAIQPSWDRFDRDYLALARQAAETALALNPELPLAHAALGLASRLPDGRPDKVAAVESMTRAITIDPMESSAWNWRGQNFAELGFFDKSIADLNRAIAIDPENLVSRAWRLRVMLLMDDVEQIMAELSTAEGGARNYAGPFLMFAYASRADKASVKALADPGEQTVDALLVQALTDANADHDELFRAISERVPFFRDSPRWLYAFKQFDAIEVPMADLSGSLVWWLGVHDDFLVSDKRYALFRSQGLEDYWRARGFPPQCEALDGGDYRCGTWAR